MPKIFNYQTAFLYPGIKPKLNRFFKECLDNLNDRETDRDVLLSKHLVCTLDFNRKDEEVFLFVFKKL
jgi:hypothetical protein